MAASFLDTNVLIYLASSDATKADRVEQLLATECVISVQVLNELANVMRRKMSLEWQETREFLEAVRALTSVRPVDLETHELGLRVAQRYRLSVYDGLILGAALLADCKTLWSEDMHDGLQIEDRLTIRNPFA